MAIEPEGVWSRSIGWLLERQIIALTLALLILGAGLMVHPFEDAADLVDEVFGKMSRAPVAVDAIPDIGANQQIVYTTWPGRSPRDIEDQITYPLTTQLLGLPGVRTVRSSSMFGFSSIYVIFEDDVEFYWSRARILEKLAARSPDALPEGATPVLGPDATALGQVYWYTLEGRDPETDEVLGGWDLHELRGVQDWTVRHALQATPGVSEVASVGGYVTEYQIDVDPKKLEAYGVTLTQLAGAVRESNQDIGARTIEINRVEYVVRGVGKLESPSDVEQTVVVERDGHPLHIGDLARVRLGPAERRGALDVNGAEAVGGVVVARYGENPVRVLEALRERINMLQPALPERKLSNGRTSKITIVPFYDRSVVVRETIKTLSDTLIQQILITMIVVLVLLGNLRTSLVISSVLPLSVLGTFVLMKVVGVTANVMSLAGIAIAIGTMVDMGIVLTERMFAQAQQAEPGERVQAIRRGAAQVAPAVATSALTTVLSFLPVFGLTAAEGKLFGPLAYTKTFALLVALGLSLIVLPVLAAWAFREPKASIPNPLAPRARWVMNALAVLVILGLLTQSWTPLGAGASWGLHAVFVAGASLGVLGVFWAFLEVYE
ncbi:MAG: efflux RND transporter permease subunit, partial [Myxococcota bacterium]